MPAEVSEGSTESTAEALARRLPATELVGDVSRRFIVLRSADNASTLRDRMRSFDVKKPATD